MEEILIQETLKETVSKEQQMQMIRHLLYVPDYEASSLNSS